jgi:hypothetical protein
MRDRANESEVRQQSRMTFVIMAIRGAAQSCWFFHGKFTCRINLLCARSVLGYSLGIGSDN